MSIILWIVSILILTPLILNFLGVQVREGGTWLIPKGEHSPKYNWFPLVLRKRNSSSKGSVKFEITSAMLHNMNADDNDDWNKITGEAFFTLESLKASMEIKKAPHHLNSWRLGWSYLPEVDTVRLAIYYYAYGERMHEVFHTFTMANRREFTLDYVYDANGIAFYLKNSDGVQIGAGVQISSTHYSGWTYRLRPYFGGNQVAPQDVPVKYEFI